MGASTMVRDPVCGMWVDSVAPGSGAVFRPRSGLGPTAASQHVHLIGIGTGAAYGYSVLATLAPGVFPAAFRSHGGAVSVCFEAAAVITMLVLLGQVLEPRARRRVDLSP